MTRHSLRFLVALVTSAAVLATACSSGAATPAAKATASQGAAGGAAPAAAGASAAGGSAGATSAAGGCPTAAPPPLPAGQTRTVTIETSAGKIVVKLEASLGPRAAGNFVALAACGYFSNVIFHRLVPGFVIQGGDGEFGRMPAVDVAHVGQGGPGYAFRDDPVTVPYSRGIVAMANSGPNTNGSQFFIVLADAGLPPSYSVFGHVTAGMDVVDKIAAMPNNGNRYGNQPVQPVAMISVTVATP